MCDTLLSCWVPRLLLPSGKGSGWQTGGGGSGPERQFVRRHCLCLRGTAIAISKRWRSWDLSVPSHSVGARSDPHIHAARIHD